MHKKVLSCVNTLSLAAHSTVGMKYQIAFALFPFLLPSPVDTKCLFPPPPNSASPPFTRGKKTRVRGKYRPGSPHAQQMNIKEPGEVKTQGRRRRIYSKFSSSLSLSGRLETTTATSSKEAPLFPPGNSFFLHFPGGGRERGTEGGRHVRKVSEVCG